MRIARLVIERKLTPGERLREQDLADQFGVSRGPIREAFRMLETSGLVESEPMRGVSMRRFTDGEMIDSSMISGFVMGLASRRAAELGTPEQKAELSARVDEFRETGDSLPLDVYVWTSVRLGDYVFQMAGSRVLTEQMRTCFLFGPALVHAPLALSTRPLRVRNLRDWGKLRDHIVAGDGPRAEQQTRRLHQQGLLDALELLGREPHLRVM
ncbi:MAG: GntR family transcriptional regulator [Alphaproteobacteria bacterium]|nr:GntR family transcriptional regulator [Alphaproteobacteria bacterium]